MIVNFSTGNFLSFRDIKTLSFEAGSISELPENVMKVGKQNCSVLPLCMERIPVAKATLSKRSTE
jgi:hypothetical protein